MAKKNEEVKKEEVVLDEVPAMEEVEKEEVKKPLTKIVREKGEMGYYKGRHYKVLNGATGVGQWGDTGECFAICDLLELVKKEK